MSEVQKFTLLVKRMRDAQVEYFRTKQGLMECKDLERHVDRMTKELLDNQKSLFDKGGETYQ